MKVLVYVRKEPLLTFYNNLAGFISDNDFYSISEFRNTGNSWLGKFLYSNDKKVIFDEEEAKNIYYRCRFLRANSFDFSYNLINKMATGIQEIINQYEPKIILAPIIDNYTLDILERLAKKNQIPYISFCGHFFPGYSRITSRGEYNYYPRIVNEQEIDEVSTAILKKSYKPQFHENLKVSLIDRYILFIREFMKKNFYFKIMRIVEQDRNNYHYNTYSNDSFIKEIKKFIGNPNKYFTKVEDIGYADNNIYLPLHLTPEATVDYWCDNYMYGAMYEKSISNIIKNSTRDAIFLIKEHPAMYMLRNKDFYEFLLSYRNVKLIHPLESSNALLDKTNIVFTENGSVGVEALVRNKLVLSNSSNYYDRFHPNIHRRNLVSADDMKISVKNYDNKLFIRDILQGNIKGRLYNNKSILKSEVSLIYKQIKFYY